jgi:glycosyltransferase involved in cell wall biosynthesis
MQILYYTFVIAFSIQMLYYFFLFFRVVFFKAKKTKSKAVKPVSVLVCAKNEVENCQKYLPYILAQDYPNFELVLINDGSTDATLTVFEAFASKHKDIKIVNVLENERYWGTKKYALSLGIKAASHEHLLFTDADCKPSSKHWITAIMDTVSNKKQLLLGYGAYKKQKGFLNKLIRYETLFTALQYFSYQLAGIPYMGVGRNMLYTKTLFDTNNGFYTHMNIPSGDDDLFVNEVATKVNSVIVIDKDAFTISKPKATFKAWFRQKRRHINTASHYKKTHQLLLGMHYISLVFLWISAFVLLLFQFQWQTVGALFGIKIVLHYIIIYSTANKLNEKDLIIFSPILEIVLILMQFAQFLYNKFSKPIHWS